MKVNDNAEVQAYIEVTEITPDVLTQLHSYGVTVEVIGRPRPDKSAGEVLTRIPTVQGLLPLTMINRVSGLPFVRYIRIPDYGIRSTGSVDSQGDAILQAMQARTQFGVDGTGIRVGVISDGIGGVFNTNCTMCGPTTATPSPITLGDLPKAAGTRDSSGVLTSVSGGIIARSFRSDGNLEPPASDTASGLSAEGTAMLEIIHDLAPGAQLYFANGGTGLEFERTVDYISANTDVGVDDVGWFAPPFDGTSSISMNTGNDLNTDANAIRGYFTAVGNNVFNHWGGSWNDSGANIARSCPSGGTTGTGDVQWFKTTSNTFVTGFYGSGTNPNTWNEIVIPPNSTLSVFLIWDDPFTGSSNDYDLYLYIIGQGNAPLACSVNPQTGTQPPEEFLAYTNSGNTPLDVGIFIQNVNNAAAPRNFDMFIVNTGTGGSPNLNFYTPSGSILAESDAGGSPVSVVSVGAIDQTQCTMSSNCAGSVEPYSSEGPTEATPQGAARMKPDVIATDDVIVTGAGRFGMNGTNSTATAGCAIGETPCYFAGTSAAAPHVAAIAALTLQAAPCLLSASSVNKPASARANLRNFITSTTVPLAALAQTLPNNIEGFGLVNALEAVRSTLPVLNPGPDQTVNATLQGYATVTFHGTGSDPDNCPLVFTWQTVSGSMASNGTPTGLNATFDLGIGVNQVELVAYNGGITSFSAPAKITVTDFNLVGPQSSVSIQPGQPATYTVSISSSFGPFTNFISLACSGLPALASCSFSPTILTPGSGTTTSTLTITTIAASSGLPLRRRWPSLPLFSLWLSLLLVILIATILAKRSSQRLAEAFAFGLLVFCLGSALMACGGGSSTNGGASSAMSSPGTPAGTYTITVTGASNQLQHSTTVSLNVS